MADYYRWREAGPLHLPADQQIVALMGDSAEWYPDRRLASLHRRGDVLN